MKKVYCEDCKYRGWENIDKCYDGEIEVFFHFPARKWSNKDGNCQHYKRKWWKFRV